MNLLRTIRDLLARLGHECPAPVMHPKCEPDASETQPTDSPYTLSEEDVLPKSLARQVASLPPGFMHGVVRQTNGWDIGEGGNLVKEADIHVVLMDGNESDIHVRATYTGVGQEPLSLVYTPITPMTKPKKGAST